MPRRPGAVTGRLPPARHVTLPRVAFAGERGAFAEDALEAYFGTAESVPVGGFREVAERVTAGDVEAGVLPIENLVGGTVVEVYDLLLEHPLRIAGETIVPVRLCLAALPGERFESIERVYSHGQALGQAEAFLRSRGWSLLTTYNTAGSGRMIVERGERAAAAVLSPRAAALFGLQVLASDIQTSATTGRGSSSSSARDPIAGHPRHRPGRPRRRGRVRRSCSRRATSLARSIDA